MVATIRRLAWTAAPQIGVSLRIFVIDFIGQRVGSLMTSSTPNSSRDGMQLKKKAVSLFRIYRDCQASTRDCKG
jgi:hypothetical protein